MAPCQEANGEVFLIFYTIIESILTSTHKIQFHDKNFVKFVATQKQVRICHGKRVIGVRATEI